ncbi:MAG: hypothetical protein ACXABH_09440 [Candidatus Thorarchaeota archaeon]|jgi:hypothetical protein
MISKIQEISTKRNVFIGIVFTFVSLMGIVLTAITLNGVILDIRFSYSFQQVTDLFTALGSDGLQLYSIIHVIDTFYPLANGFTIIIAFNYLRKDHTGRKNQYFMIVPILGIIFDFVENILIETQIATFPIISEQVIFLASIMTTTKWIFLGCGMFVVIILALANYFRKK